MTMCPSLSPTTVKVPLEGKSCHCFTQDFCSPITQ